MFSNLLIVSWMVFTSFAPKFDFPQLTFERHQRSLTITQKMEIRNHFARREDLKQDNFLIFINYQIYNSSRKVSKLDIARIVDVESEICRTGIPDSRIYYNLVYVESGSKKSESISFNAAKMQ
jgi:hypothetical protein